MSPPNLCVKDPLVTSVLGPFHQWHDRAIFCNRQNNIENNNLVNNSTLSMACLANFEKNYNEIF